VYNGFRKLADRNFLIGTGCEKWSARSRGHGRAP